MGWSFIAWSGGGTNTDGTTLDATTTLNISVGDLLIGACRWEGADTTESIAENDGDNAFEMFSTVNGGNDDFWLGKGRKTVVNANATATLRFTLSVSRSWREFIVLQFRPDAGDTVTHDAGPNGATGTSLSPQSGTVSTTGDDTIIVGMYVGYYTNSSSNEQIGGSAADGAIDPSWPPDYPNWTKMWYKIYTSTQTDVAGSATKSDASGDEWVCDILAFKSVAAAGGVPIAIYKKYYDYRRAQ
jgi:hypothetical protein